MANIDSMSRDHKEAHEIFRIELEWTFAKVHKGVCYLSSLLEWFQQLILVKLWFSGQPSMFVLRDPKATRLES